MPKQQIFLNTDGDGTGNDTVTTDDTKGEIVDTPEFKSFREKYTARVKNPTLVGGLPTKEQFDAAGGEKKEVVELTQEQKDAAAAEAERIKQTQQKRGPGGNLPSILEGKRRAEAERDEFKTKAETVAAEKATLETKIAELQTKIDSGKLTDAKEAELQTKITEMEERIQKGDESLVNENKRLKDKVSLYDLSENETFKQQFVEPVIEAYNEAFAALGANEQLQELMGRAINANSSALQAKTQAARLTHEKDRAAIINQITSGMGEFEADAFKAGMHAYIRKSQAHAVAFQKYSETAEQIRTKEKEKQGQAYTKLIDTWGRAYDTNVAALKEEESLTKEEADLATELGLKVEDELKLHGVQGKKAVTGKATMAESAEIVSKGRLYPVLKAKIAVRDRQLADAQALIKKLRAGGTGGGGSSEQKKEEPKVGVKNADGEKMTREQWQQSRFGANRPGLVQK